MKAADQKVVFTQSEGDQYYVRNKEKLVSFEQKPSTDLVLASLENRNIRPQCALEIGCSNGWRLEALRSFSQAKCFGIDPSAAGIAEGSAKFTKISLQQGTADHLPYPDGQFDLVIFGFCLYLCDRTDLFKIAFETDRVLQNNGHIAILDFHPTFPYRNAYKHHPGLYSYKMNYSNLFTWNPSYTLVSQTITTHAGAPHLEEPDDRISVIVLQKQSQYAYPDAASFDR